MVCEENVSPNTPIVIAKKNKALCKLDLYNEYLNIINLNILINLLLYYDCLYEHLISHDGDDDGTTIGITLK